MKAVVLLSGGVDSATCLGMSVYCYGNKEVTALSIYYCQKHEKELACSKKLAEHYGVQHIVRDISSIMELSDCCLLKNSKNENEMYMNYGYSLLKAREEIIKEFKDKIRGV